jgi:hypothetical protein
LLDYRTGALGRISLETPELRTTRARELQQSAAPLRDPDPGTVHDEND